MNSPLENTATDVTVSQANSNYLHIKVCCWCEAPCGRMLRSGEVLLGGLSVLLSVAGRQTPPPTARPTVGAVPLEGRDVVRLDTTLRPTVAAVPLLRGDGETSPTPDMPTTKEMPMGDGMIPWAIYSANDSMTPVNLPSALPGFLLPNYTSKGRWLSRDKQAVKLVNSRPAFIHPLVPLRNIKSHVEEEEKGKTRVKRGSGGGTGQYSVSQCGGVFRDLYGVIKSPGYPLYYPNNKVATS